MEITELINGDNGTNYFLFVWYDYMSATGEHQLKTLR